MECPFFSQKLKRTSLLSLIYFFFITLLLSACGGGGGGSTPAGPTEREGVFLDSAVEGLTYTTGGTTSTTGPGGTFLYMPGATVTFSIGDIVIGTASGQDVITPVALVPGAADETDPTVVNIVRFLISIDDDGDPGVDGIKITSAVIAAAAGQSLDFTLSTDAFAADADVINAVAALTAVTTSGISTLATVADAQTHLNETLLSSMAGIYNGTYSGDTSGTWSLTVGTDGSITGSGCNTVFSSSFTASGTVSSDGNTAVGVASSTATWEGNVNLTGVFSGTWQDGVESGTFTGVRADSSAGGSCTSGGGGGGSGSGSLAISGADTSSLGATFGPVLVTIPSIIPGGIYGTITWSSTPDFASTYVGRVVSISLNPSTNEIQSVRFFDSSSGLWGYELICSVGDCSGASIDQTTGTVTFNNIALPVYTAAALNQATAPITLTGTLTYPATPSGTPGGGGSTVDTSAFAGTYEGTLDGSVPGSWTFTIDSSGNLTGTAMPDTGGTNAFSASVDGSGGITGSDGTSIFASILSDGSVSGVFFLVTDAGLHGGGAFSGSRQ